MTSITKIMYVSLAGLLLMSALSTACSEEQPQISRVQTNLVDKSIFDGEWWYSSTAIDVSYDEAFVFNSANALAPFSGSMSTDYALDYNRGGTNVLGAPAYSFPIARVRFVIDEKYLFAYRSYELVSGGNGDAHDADFLGQPLAVFAIDDHVDVRKEYDDVTGETNNVTVENTTDRKWYERKFMRVDWSRNLLEDFSANDVQANELFTAFRRSSVPFFVQSGTHDSDFPKSYQPQFIRIGDDKTYARTDEWDLEKDKDTVHYMSFVTQESWSPEGSCLQYGGVCASATATMRNAFLRVPPKHEYAVQTETNNEFDRFGLFRSNQPSYARGGADTAVQHKHCSRDSDCGPGGACDTAQRRAADCQAAGKTANCRVEQNICVGGLTEDQGETDFLNYYVSRLNLYSDSLTDTSCNEDWECDGRYGAVCDKDDPKKCVGTEGSVCDLSAKRCTLPLDQRKVRPVQFYLTKNFPPYLARRAFDAMGQWNEAMMRAQRATKGILPFDQQLCGAGNNEVCTTDLSKDAQISCQNDDPTAYCFCGSPEDIDGRGKCRMGYDPFEKPAAAKARGIPNPYDCYIEGPADVKNPTHYEDYAAADAYAYTFKGKECILTLQANSCDKDSKQPCEELGDIRYHFVSHIQHGGAGFGGVAQPLSDPKTGELIVSTATMASESIETIGTLASQFFPVLRGDVPEDTYFTGENVRGYYSRLGKVEHPVATVPSNTSGNEIGDDSRPTRDDFDAAADADKQSMDAFKQLQQRMDRVAAKVAKLKGPEGRAATFSGRKAALKGKSIDQQLAGSLTDALKSPSPLTAAGVPVGNGTALDGPMAELEQERKRKQQLSSRNMDSFEDQLYNSQYYRYYADRFKNRTTEEASLRMQQAYFRGVAIHELGHVLGLRHNFAGSLDRNNYPDPYFNIAKQTPLPNIIEYDDASHGGNGDGEIIGEETQRYARDLRAAREERLQQGAGNVMTASVMDYNANLSDYFGLGRYDKAAAAYAYFNKVEAYQTGTPESDPSLGDPDSLPLAFSDLERPDLYRRELWSYYRGGESCQTDMDCPNRAGRNVTAFQSISQRCVANPRLQLTGNGCTEPGACVCSNFYDDFDAYSAGTAYRGRAEAPKFAPVKYLYCHDNRVGDLSWCSQSDAGESFQEVVENYRRSWRERYPRAYFRNFRASGPAKGSSYDTVVEAVKIYQHMFFRSNFEGPEYRSRIGSLGYYDQLFASSSALDWLTEIIGTPDVGSYKLQMDQEGKPVYRQISPEPGAEGSELDLGVGEGFYLWSQYQTGQNGFFRLERAGTFLDKLLAIQAITKRDWGLTYQVDEFYYVNFFDVFQKEVIDLFGGLIMRNPRQYAPRSENGTLTYLSTFRMDDRANVDTTYPAPAVDGTDTEVLRDIATIEALAEFPVYYDTSFEQRLLVFKNGSGDGYQIPTTRKDGTPTCQDGDMNCPNPDYITYDSDRLHTQYVAVVVDPEETGKIDEQQLAFQLLKRLKVRQDRLRVLRGNAMRSPDEQAELERLAPDVERDESYLEYLIELERQLGISSYFF